ncbi:MAG: bifunctional phosphoglucose/phosphomannose isomerase [Candidatus Bathyarchaeota archaeon]|nr:bifunctional phosphoglucose/phosphomannose isomerase [Candidatus Bathyarchaeota archaeon]
MDHSLDDPDTLKQYDRKGMLKAIKDFPQSAVKAISDSEEVDLSKLEGETFNAIIIAGMGGSAVGGILLRDWLIDTCSVPIVISQGHHLPAWVGKDTLVYVVSYSGYTEETLSQYREAIGKGSKIIAFCSGGSLSQNASRRKFPRIKYPKGYQPRAAIAFQFFSIATITRRLGFISDETWAEVDEALKVLTRLSEEMSPEMPIEENPGKALAESVKGYTPFIYGSRLYTGVAYRYSTQFNENSKSPASAGFFPEAFHNRVMAREATPEQLEKCCVVVIRDPRDEEAMANKINRFMGLVAERYGRVVEVEPEGEGKLARMLSALYMGDYASAYLGILYGHDPSSTESIDLLKQSQ